MKQTIRRRHLRFSSVFDQNCRGLFLFLSWAMLRVQLWAKERATCLKIHRRARGARGEKTGERMALAFRSLSKPRTVQLKKETVTGGSAESPRERLFPIENSEIYEIQKETKDLSCGRLPVLLRSLLFKKNVGGIGLGFIWSVGRAKQSFEKVRSPNGVWEREGK